MFRDRVHDSEWDVGRMMRTRHHGNGERSGKMDCGYCCSSFVIVDGIRIGIMMMWSMASRAASQMISYVLRMAISDTFNHIQSV